MKDTDLANCKDCINFNILIMKRDVFNDCINAVLEHVIEGLKDDIKNQLEFISADGGMCDNEESLCNLKVSLSQLESSILFLSYMKNGEEADRETKESIHTTLYVETPYYGFVVIEIINESGIDADAEEFNKILISYLEGKISINDIEDN